MVHRRLADIVQTHKILLNKPFSYKLSPFHFVFSFAIPLHRLFMLSKDKKMRPFCNEREIYKGENRGEISNRNVRLNGAYYVFLFHGCQINNGVNCAKFCLIFVDIQHFMLFVVAVGVV